MTVSILLYTKATGHVLGAASLAAPPSSDVKPEALAGDFLPVRHNGDPTENVLGEPAVTVPASELAVLSVDAATVTIATARMTFVDLATKTPKPLNVSTPTLTLTNSTLTVSFLPVSTAKTTIWARIGPINSGSTAVQPQTVSVEVTPPSITNTSSQLTLTPLPSGEEYGVLALVPGLIPALQKFPL